MYVKFKYQLGQINLVIFQLLEGDWTMLFRAFWNWVDAFVVMSGLLTAFYAFGKLSKGQKINIPKMYLQRYIK
jgi:hypothetical protein